MGTRRSYAAQVTATTTGSAPVSPPGPDALVTMELQRGVVGDLTELGALRDAAVERDILRSCGELAGAARRAGKPVVHCVAQWRADRRGTSLNTPLTKSLSANRDHILAGSAAVEPVAELGDTSDDLRSVRHHGVAPFHGTDLEPLLRSLDATHIAVTGVSLNVGIPGLVIGAVDRGFEVTVVTDAVIGIPTEYGDAVLRHSLSALARLSPVAAVIDSWSC